MGQELATASLIRLAQKDRVDRRAAVGRVTLLGFNRLVVESNTGPPPAPNKKFENFRKTTEKTLCMKLEHRVWPGFGSTSPKLRKREAASTPGVQLRRARAFLGAGGPLRHRRAEGDHTKRCTGATQAKRRNAKSVLEATPAPKRACATQVASSVAPPVLTRVCTTQVASSVLAAPPAPKHACARPVASSVPPETSESCGSASSSTTKRPTECTATRATKRPSQCTAMRATKRPTECTETQAKKAVSSLLEQYLRRRGLASSPACHAFSKSASANRVASKLASANSVASKLASANSGAARIRAVRW